MQQQTGQGQKVKRSKVNLQGAGNIAAASRTVTVTVVTLIDKIVLHTLGYMKKQYKRKQYQAAL